MSRKAVREASQNEQILESESEETSHGKQVRGNKSEDSVAPSQGW